ncbi:MAG: DMT family transporter [Acidimicrobiia bacterium]|nr:DMT family transporter [Acidimicrobiia bacterium]
MPPVPPAVPSAESAAPPATASTVPEGGLAGMGARHPNAMVWFGVVLFSTGPVAVAASSLSGVTFSFWRLWFGVAILGCAGLVHRVATRTATPAIGWAWALGCGVVFALHQAAFMTAVQATSVVDVTLMNTLAPIVVGLLAVRVFAERPGARFRMWSLVAMVGAAGVALAGGTGPEGDPFGMALAAVNVVFFAFFMVGAKLARPHVDTMPFLFGTMGAAAIVVTLLVGVTGEAVRPVSGRDLLLCAGVALLPGFVGHFSVTWALRRLPANVPPVIMLTIPVFSGFGAWWLLGEAVTLLQVVAGLATVAGVAGAVWSASSRRGAVDEALALSEES